MTDELGQNELFARLRAKYQGSDTHTIDGVAAQDQAAAQGVSSCQAATNLGQAAAAALPGVRLCPACQGSGIQQQVYEFRRLESTCSHCQGEGVFVTAAAVKRSQPQQQQRISSDANNGCCSDDSPSFSRQQQPAARDTAAAASGAAPVPGDASCRVEAALPRMSSLQRTASRNQRQLSNMREKIEELQQEYAELSTKAAASASAEERRLQEELMQHLALHVAHLQSVLRDKAAACGADIPGGC